MPFYDRLDRKGLIYHFTSAESLFKIIETGVLKISPLSKMNDIREMEVSGLIPGGCTMPNVAIKEYIKKKH